MQWLERFSAKKGTVGIEVLPDGLAVAARACHGQGDVIDFISLLTPDSESGSLQEELTSFVAKHRIGKRLCNIILGHKDYQLLLVEAPDVDAADMREAVRWKIKDLIPMPLEQAVIDVFELPRDASKTAKKMVYVVVSHLNRIRSLIGLINESGLSLSSIDVGELAMRNVSLVVGADYQERGLGIVRLRAGGGVVSLYKDGNLYLARQFKLKYNGGLLDDLPIDTLALEVQRSLDYYERQMGISPPATLYFCGENVSEDKITQELTRSITVPVNHLDMSDRIEFDGEVDEGLVQVCLGALGGVYRGEKLA